MRIIKPTFEILEHDSNTNPQQFIEKIARTCYKSEDKITKDSNRKFIKAIYDRGHWAMLEHYIFTYETNDRLTRILKGFCPRYITILESAKGTYIAFSARALLEIEQTLKEKQNIFLGVAGLEVRVVSLIITYIINTVIKDYDCYELFGKDREQKGQIDLGHPENYYLLKRVNEEDIIEECRRLLIWRSVKFTTSRAVSHELVRHRPCSFSQESQRYVNYAKGKFGAEIRVIEPCFFEKNSAPYEIWRDTEELIEKKYMDLINNGAKPQEARELLSNSTKTEIVVTAPLSQWEKMFFLRCDTPANPSMRQLMIPVFNSFYEEYPNIFEEVKNKINLDFDYPLAEQLK